MKCEKCGHDNANLTAVYDMAGLVGDMAGLVHKIVVLVRKYGPLNPEIVEFGKVAFEMEHRLALHAPLPKPKDESELALPWHIGNTSDDQVMFLDSKERYAGGVTIRQFQGRGAYDEPRRRACAEHILESVNKKKSVTDEWWDSLDEGQKSEGMLEGSFIRRAPKPSTDPQVEGLFVAIKEYCYKLNDDKNNESRQEITETLLRILNCHPTPQTDNGQEPLAVLADRKGYWKVSFTRSCDAMAENYWTCVVQKTSFDIRVDKQRDYDFVAPTYAAAEQAARQYLNGLDNAQTDKGGRE